MPSVNTVIFATRKKTTARARVRKLSSTDVQWYIVSSSSSFLLRRLLPSPSKKKKKKKRRRTRLFRGSGKEIEIHVDIADPVRDSLGSPDSSDFTPSASLARHSIARRSMKPRHRWRRLKSVSCKKKCEVRRARE